MKALLLTLCVAAVCAATFNSTSKLWPRPANLSFTTEGENVTASPCDIKYVVESPGQIYVQEMINLYLIQVFQCTKIQEGKIVMNVVVRSTDVMLPTDVKHEKYSLIIRNNSRWELSADYYPGFLRGLETFSQLFEKNETEEEYVIYNVPVVISDAPQYIWRSVMIDTSRHFLPVATIKRAIDAMMYSKLNVLHWHITDEDAFPLYIPALPELSESGSVGGVYSQLDVKAIISYGKTRGVRVVPEIDTPAHSESWGRSEKYKYITLNCNGKYEGQLDPTLNLTWDVLSEVLKHVNTTFVDDYAHFGGDEVVYSCWSNRQNIVDWMKANNISDTKALSIYFRQKQKKLWRTISPAKKVIYWANEDIDLPVEDDDVIHWWGVSANVNKMAGRKNQVILSNYDLTYLDIGFGNFYGKNYGTYEQWRHAYAFEPRITNVNVIGGAACMWNEVGTTRTFEQKVLQRASVIGERLWNVKIDIKTELRNIATRLTAHSERLRERGFKVWPVTVGICEKDPSICF